MADELYLQRASVSKSVEHKKNLFTCKLFKSGTFKAKKSYIIRPKIMENVQIESQNLSLEAYVNVGPPRKATALCTVFDSNSHMISFYPTCTVVHDQQRCHQR